MPSFKDLNLHADSSTTTCVINDQEVTVKYSIPLQDMIDLIQITLQKSEEDGIYNQLKLDAYFTLNYIYLYTDIEFSDEDREDELALYDILNSNDVLVDILGAQSVDAEGNEANPEYEMLFETLQIMMERNLDYKNTAAAVLQKIIQDLPANAQAAREIVDSFDKEKYSEVVEFAQAANGGRNIVTNN